MRVSGSPTNSRAKPSASGAPGSAGACGCGGATRRGRGRAPRGTGAKRSGRRRPGRRARSPRATRLLEKGEGDDFRIGELLRRLVAASLGVEVPVRVVDLAEQDGGRFFQDACRRGIVSFGRPMLPWSGLRMASVLPQTAQQTSRLTPGLALAACRSFVTLLVMSRRAQALTNCKRATR
jgi:hypothetical protein